MTIEVRPLQGTRERQTFLTFPWRIYRGDPLWVPPILTERAKTIDPEKGAFFERGEAEFFVAWQNREAVGTICAAEDAFANEARERQECLFGFFECVDDEAVARSLFDQVTQWARERGLNALVGPFNLDYENGYGILVEGRDRPPTLFCGHTPPYYQELVESLGFQPARGDNLAYAIDLDLEAPPFQRLSRLAERVRARERISIRSADLQHWDSEVDHVHDLLGQSLTHLPDYFPWHRDALQAALEPFRDVADAELILFAEVEGETVGWLPGIANLNEALRYANGLRYPWDYVRLWRHLRRRPECLAVKSVLVLPDYWGTGVGTLLFGEIARRAQARGFKWIDLSLTSADNPHTPILAERMGARVYKRYRVYRLEIESE